MMGEKQALVPRLRFPEFREAGEWEMAPLGEKVDLLSGFPFKSADISDNSDGTPLMRGINITEGFVRHTSDIDKYFLGDDKPLEKYKLKANDLVIGMDGSKVGKNSALITEDDAGSLLIQRVARLRAKCEATIRHIFQHINSSKFHSYVDRINTSGGIPHISAKQIDEFEICFPPAEKEQQKIGDCLSSLDALIAAQADKIDALKTHKIGLMQQLFPSEGETVPRMRFPEFRDAGEWTVKALGELVDVIDGDRGVNYPKAEEFSLSGFCLFLSAKNVTKNGFKFTETQFIEKSKDEALRNGKLKRNDVVLTTRGSVGQFAYFSEDIPYENIRINSGMVILRVSSEEIVTDYLYAFSKSAALAMHIENMAFGNAQQQLTVGGIKKIPICFPGVDEQQKIADCLSSCDALIAAQTDKLEVLKANKKGLMQQLFPSPGEVVV